MTDDDPYPYGEDAEWLALDRDGLIARFTTGGAGPVPRGVTAHWEAHRALGELIEKARHESWANPGAGHPPEPDFMQCAERGVFAYDWAGVPSRASGIADAYQLLAQPTKPLAFAALPGVPEGMAALLPRFSFSFAERTRVAIEGEVDWLRPGDGPSGGGGDVTWPRDLWEAEEIRRQVSATMERLRLNRGDEARYDEAGRQVLLQALQHATRLGYRHGIADATMFLGRLLQLKRRYGEARLLYLKSKTLFAELESAHWVPAKEYLSECPEGNAAARKLYDERCDAVASSAVSAAALAAEFFPEPAEAQPVAMQPVAEGGKKPSFWQRLFG